MTDQAWSEAFGDASEPMPVPPALKATTEQFSIAPSARPVGAPDPRTGVPKRPRGRPPGSRNRVREPDGGRNTPSTVTIPPGRRPPSTPPTDDEEKKRLQQKQEKKERAEQYAEYINKELNDQLFMFLIASSGGAIKAEHLYKEGRVPPKAAGNPNFSDMGNAIAIPPDVADSWGKLLAELSYTGTGKSVVKMSDNNVLGITIAAVTAAYSTYRYGLQLKSVMEGIKKAQDEIRKAQQDASASENT
jgi:hypothetical protein